MDFDELLKRSAAVSNAKYKREYVKVSDIKTVRDLYEFNVLVSSRVANCLFADFDCNDIVYCKKLDNFLRQLDQDWNTNLVEWFESALKDDSIRGNIDPLVLMHTYICSNIVRYFDSISLDKTDGIPRCYVNFNIDAKPIKPEEVAKSLFAVLNTGFQENGDLELYCKFSFEGNTHIVPVLKSDFLEIKAEMSKYLVAGLDV